MSHEGPAHGAPRTDVRRTAFWIFLFFTCFYAALSSGRLRTPDEYMVFFQAESLVTRGATSVPQTLRTGNLFGKVDPHGEPRAPYGLAHAVLSAPFCALGRLAARTLPGVPPGAQWLLVMTFTCLSSATFVAATLALYFLVAWRLTQRFQVSLAATAVVGFSTILFAYSGYFFAEALVAFLFMAAAWALVGRPDGDDGLLRRAGLAGVLLAVCTWVRFTHVLAVPVFAAALLFGGVRRQWRAAALLAACGVVGVGAHLLYNYWLWGTPLEFGYPTTAEGGRSILVFDVPWWKGLSGFFFSPGKSILLFSPPLLFGLMRLRRLRDHDRVVFAVATLLPVAYLLLYMRYTLWEGGYCVGPRYLVPACALLALSIATGLVGASRTERRALLGLAVVGLAVQVVSTATSFLEDQTAGHKYYDAGWTYRWDYAPMRSQGQLLAKYLLDPRPAPLGLGFDRWFLFLTKAGVDPRTVAALLAVPIAGALFAAVRLLREVRR